MSSPHPTQPTQISQGLSVIIEPLSSSFFAGQEFSTRITFKNTRIPIPQSQPLPDVERFQGQPPNLDLSPNSGLSVSSNPSIDRRVVSAAPGIGINSNGSGSGSGSSIGESSFGKNKNDNKISKAGGSGLPSRKRLIGSNALKYEDRENLGLSPRGDEDRGNGKGRMFDGDLQESTGSSSKGVDSRTTKGSINKTYDGLNGDPSRKDAMGTELGLGRPSGPQGQVDGGGNGVRQALIPSSDAPINSPSTSFNPRRTSQPISSSHPHARKQSILDSQAMALQDSFGPNEVSVPPSPSLSERSQKDLYSLNENDEEDEGETESNLTPRGSLNNSRDEFDQQDFYQQGRNDTMESVVRDKMTDWSGIGLGSQKDRDRRSSISSVTSSQSRNSNNPNTPTSRSSKKPLVPGTETLLWSFAQLRGTCEIDETLIKAEDFERLKKRLAYGEGQGDSNLKGGRKILGGGEFDLGGGFGFNHLNHGTLGNEDSWSSYLKSALWLSSSTSNSAQSKRSSSSLSFNSDDGSTPYSPHSSISEFPTSMSSNSSISSKASEKASGHKHKRTGSTMLDNHTRTLTSKSFPTFSMPPSMIAIDLVLKPGESKSYIFRTALPSDLPPSYLGKSIKFNYTLGIGTNRLSQPLSAAVRSYSSTPSQKSRLIQLPLRLYNHVGVQGFRPSFDLLNPVVRIKDEGICEEDLESSSKNLKGSQFENQMDFEDGFSQRGGNRKKEEEKLRRTEKEVENQRIGKERKEMESYARSLLKECQEEGEEDEIEEEEGNQSLSPASTTSSKARSPLSPLGRRTMLSGSSNSGTGLSNNDEEPETNCKSAIELLVKSSGKVSYDIAKDGKVAAVLTLVKSKYRLGDTVTGVVTINAEGAIARIVRIAATLETHEEIQPTLAMLPPGRSHKTTKRVHAEHHESTLDAGRASFALPIPGGATPEFTTSGVKLNWNLRLSFLTLSTFQDPSTTSNPETSSIKIPPPPHLVPSPSDGFSLYHTSYLAVPSLCGKLPVFNPSEAIGDKITDSNGFGKESKLEIVECAVPITVLPHSSFFQVKPAHFQA